MLLDKVSASYWADADFREELAHSRPLSEVVGERFDLVYLAGGHGTMYDFPGDVHLQELVRQQYERGALVGAICHGVGGLLNVRLSSGAYLIEGRRLTGFSWFEEALARRKSAVPFNLEAELKQRGPIYKKPSCQ